VEYELLCHTSNHWGRWSYNQRTKKKYISKQYQESIKYILHKKRAELGSLHIIRKVLQSEWWGSPLIQEEKYQEKKKPVLRENNNKK
jgi:hypothetical protein